MIPILQILSCGVGLSIQDPGRPGWRRFGVPAGGAMDAFSARSANALLGNSPTAPVLEILLQGAQLRVLVDTWLALAGADLGAELAPWTASRFPAGTVLDFSHNHSGLWAYLAVPGGLVADRWFGSVSVDARNGLGIPLRTGDRLEAASPSSSLPPESPLTTARLHRRLLLPEDRRDFSRSRVFFLLPGPQFEAFSIRSRYLLEESVWTVSARSDRTGFRLEGPSLEVPASLPSEPVLPGSLQVPGEGQPIITMNDGPTVGGYAKIGVLREAARDWLAQCRPGTPIAFRWPPLLGCDLGENESSAVTAALMARIDVASIGCGVHAGSAAKTRETLELAKRQGVLVGAHPGLPGQGGRGREVPSAGELKVLLQEQLGDFFRLATECGVTVSHVKLHGILYHAVEEDVDLAGVYLRRVKTLLPQATIFSRAGGKLARKARAQGFKVREEAFADRGIDRAGRLLPRDQPGALLEDPAFVVRRVAHWLQSGEMPALQGSSIPLPAGTLCVHSDSPNARQILDALRKLPGFLSPGTG